MILAMVADISNKVLKLQSAYAPNQNDGCIMRKYLIFTPPMIMPCPHCRIPIYAVPVGVPALHGVTRTVSVAVTDVSLTYYTPFRTNGNDRRRGARILNIDSGAPIIVVED